MEGCDADNLQKEAVEGCPMKYRRHPPGYERGSVTTEIEEILGVALIWCLHCKHQFPNYRILVRPVPVGVPPVFTCLLYRNVIRMLCMYLVEFTVY